MEQLKEREKKGGREEMEEMRYETQHAESPWKKSVKFKFKFLTELSFGLEYCRHRKLSD